jgi:hypothetical protein
MAKEFRLYIDDKFLGIGSLTKVNSVIRRYVSRFPKTNIASIHIRVENASGMNNQGIKRL